MTEKYWLPIFPSHINAHRRYGIHILNGGNTHIHVLKIHTLIYATHLHFTWASLEFKYHKRTAESSRSIFPWTGVKPHFKTLFQHYSSMPSIFSSRAFLFVCLYVKHEQLKIIRSVCMYLKTQAITKSRVKLRESSVWSTMKYIVSKWSDVSVWKSKNINGIHPVDRRSSPLFLSLSLSVAARTAGWLN